MRAWRAMLDTKELLSGQDDEGLKRNNYSEIKRKCLGDRIGTTSRWTQYKRWEKEKTLVPHLVSGNWWCHSPRQKLILFFPAFYHLGKLHKICPQIHWFGVSHASYESTRLTDEKSQHRLVWLRWLVHHPVHQRQQFHPWPGPCLGCKFNPWSGHMWEAIDQCMINLSLSHQYLAQPPHLYSI